MAKIIVRTQARLRRHYRSRSKIVGTPDRPRLSVYRSQKNLIAQIIDDTRGLTLSEASTLSKEVRAKVKGQKPLEAAKWVGKILAEKAMEKKIGKVVFDKSGYQYHGRVKALAEGAREGGLKF